MEAHQAPEWRFADHENEVNSTILERKESDDSSNDISVFAWEVKIQKNEIKEKEQKRKEGRKLEEVGGRYRANGPHALLEQ